MKKQKKILIFVNSFYQLVVAVNLKNTLFCYDKVDLFITNFTPNCYKVYEKIRKNNIFNEVRYIKAYKISKNDKLTKKIIIGLKMKMSKKAEKFNLPVDLKYDYDELLFYTIVPETLYLSHCINKNNKNFRCSRFEEGFVSYYRDIPISKELNFVISDKIVKEKMKNYYFFETDLAIVKHYNYNFKTIPKLDRSNVPFLNDLKKIFNINKVTKIKEKYIFFEQWFHQDRNDIDDLELVLRISDIVGKDNLLVKLHPSTKEDRFSKYGIKVSKNSDIPLEALQLIDNYDDKIFITIYSGCIINQKILFDNNIKSYFLSNCYNIDMEGDFEAFLEVYSAKFDSDNIEFPKNLNSFYTSLKKGVKQERRKTNEKR
ncbi:MAG: hypothetical protein R3Y21_03690 [Mycoplasmatota bacterium]